MGAWIIVGLTLAAYGYALYKQSHIASPQPERWKEPTAEEGVAIPVVFGSAIVRNVSINGFYDREIRANSVGTLDDAGNLIVNESTNKGSALYIATVHLGLCQGKIDQLLEVYASDKSCLVSQDAVATGETRARLAIGRDTEHSSNWGGFAGIYDGAANLSTVDTGISNYLAKTLGMPGGIGSQYFGVATALLVRFMWGAAPAVSPLAFAVKRIHTRLGGTAVQWYDEKAEISEGVRGREDVWKWNLAAKSDNTDYSGASYDDSGWNQNAGGFGNAPAGHVMATDLTNYTTVPPVLTCIAGYTLAGALIGGYPNYSVPEGMKLWLRWNMGPMPAFTTVVQCWHDDSASLWFNGNEIALTPANVDLLEEHFTSTALIPAEYINEAGPNIVAYRVRDSYSADGATRIGTNKLIYAGLQIGAAINAEPPPGIGSMNPAHMIREALTDTLWGMGYSDLDMDDVSFTAAASTLYDEGLGLSFEWAQQSPIEDLINEIKRHISAVVYIAPDTGLYTLKLIREDFTVGDLPVLDESHIVEISEASRKQPGELINCVTVTYTASLRGDTGSTEPIFDDNLVEIQGGIVSAQVDYPGITTPVNAAKLALRDLRILSAPLLTCRIVADRFAADFYPSKPFVLNWPSLGFDNVVMRVDEMDSGNGIDNKVTLTCIEDVFAFPSQALVMPNDPVGLSPVVAPTSTVAADSYKTALTIDTRNRGMIETAFNYSGWGEGSVFDTFAETEPGVMVRISTGPLAPAMFDGINPFTGVVGGSGYGTGEQWIVGRIVFALAAEGDVSGGKKYQGGWIVDDIGAHWENFGTPDQAFVATNARMHRAPGFSASGDFAKDMVVQVRNGTIYGGHFLQLGTANVVLGTTEQEWADVGTSFTFADTYDLLRSDQFAGRQTSPDSLQLIAQTGVIADFSHAFATLAGTPGAMSIPAGLHTITPSACILSGGDPGAITTLGFKLFRSGSTPAVLYEMQTAALVDGFNVLAALSYQAPDYPLTNTDLLVLIPTLHTTSTTPVTVSLKFNAANAITLQMPKAQTFTLAPIDAWFDVTIVDGVIADFGTHRHLRVHGAGPLVGIDTSTCGGADSLTLAFKDAASITGAGAPSSGAPIYTEQQGTGTYQAMGCPANSIVLVVLIVDSGSSTFWKYSGGSTG
jgi:hypothetical protein